MRPAWAGKGYAEQAAALRPERAARAAGAVQMKGGGGGESAEVQRQARARVAGAGGALPHLDRIQAAFGRHDVSGGQA